MISSSIGKILVVDDEVELKNILVEALAAQGYETAGFTSGEEALAALREEAFDVLLTDLMMPGMDGITLVRESLQIDPHLVCMMMTGQGTIQTAVDAMKEGAFDYVLKPFRLQTVLPVLTRAMNTRHMLLENLQLRDTVAIYGLAQTIAFTLDPQTVISKLADAALQQTDADEVSVLLPTADGDELYVAAVRGEKHQRLLGERVPLEEGISSWVMHERTPLILDGEVNDERFRALWPRPEIRSAISVPMQVANKIVGTININALNRARPFTLGQMKALTILASTAAAALESASLYAQVQKAEEDYRSIFENAVEGIYRTTADGRFISANPAMAGILGYESPQDLIAGFPDVTRDLYVDPGRHNEWKRRLDQGEKLLGFEGQYWRRDGSPVWLSQSARAVRDESGSLLYYEGIVEDITGRKQTEKEQARLTAILQATTDMVATADLKGFVQYINHAGRKMLGLGEDQDVTNMRIADHHPEWAASIVTNVGIPAAIESGFWSGETALLSRDGREIPLSQVIIAHTAPDGTIEYLSTIGRDITERKRAEEQLRRQLDFTETITTSLGEGLYALDVGGRVTFMNPAAGAALGWTEAELLGREMHEIIHFQHADGTRHPGSECPLLGVLKSGNTVKSESDALTRKDGSVFLVSYTSSPIITEGQVVGAVLAFRDITERKRAEDALRESEERYRDLVENSLELITTHGLDGQILSANRAAAKVLGYDRKDHIGKTNLRKLLAPEARDQFDEYLTRIRKDGVASGLMLVQTRTGERRIWEYHNTLRTEGIGTPIVRSVARDITERRRAEGQLVAQYVATRALADSVTLAEATPKILRALCETLGWAWGALWTVDHKANVLRCHEVWHDRSLQLAQFEEASRELTFAPGVGLPGHVWADGQLTWIPDVAHDKNFFRAPIAARENLHGALAIPIEAGSKVFGVMEFFSKAIREPDPELLAMMTTVSSQIGQFIERKRVDEKLRESEEKYRSILERIEDGYAEVDLTGTYVFVNDSFCRITGHSASELLGVNYKELFDREHRQLLYDTYHNVYETGEPIKGFEYEVTRKDGTKRLVEESVNLKRDAEGRPIGFMGMRRDCTDRKQLEEQFRQSQKMEAIGQLAGGVAHDFNNLLTVIGGYSSILLNKLDQDSPHRTSVEEIKKASDRAGGLTRQLLAFSRKQILQPKLLDLNVVVSDLDKMVRRLIGEDIDLLAITDPNLGRVKADPGQIEQVLLNLIVNARDAMPSGGKLTIETANAVLSADYAVSHGAAGGPYVMLAVSDTGCGMDAELQKHVFEPFFTTKVTSKGTGLGLATVYGIVKQSDGHIWLYSELGKGTSFKIYLPCVDEIVVDQANAAGVPLVPKGTETLLLVEDEDQVRRIVQAILEQQGYDVLAAANGEEALQLAGLHGSQIHLLMTDVVMPRMSGRELAEELTVIRPQLKVLYMSGYTDDAIVRHGLLNASLNFIQKPFDAATVARKVREVLDSQVPEAPGGSSAEVVASGLAE